MHGFDTSVPRFVTYVRGTRIVVTPDLVSEILDIPRIAHPDYPAYQRLRTMFKDELISHFCEKPSKWGGHQNTLCLDFTKGLRFLNMVMAFVLHPLSHITSLQSLVLDFSYPFLRTSL